MLQRKHPASRKTIPVYSTSVGAKAIRQHNFDREGASVYTLAILRAVMRDVIFTSQRAVSILQPGKRMNQARSPSLGLCRLLAGGTNVGRHAIRACAFDYPSLITKPVSSVVFLALAAVLLLAPTGCATQSIARPSSLPSNVAGRADPGRYQYTLLERINSWEYQLKLKADQYDMSNIANLKEAVFERLESYAEANPNSFSIQAKTKEEKYNYRLWSAAQFGDESAVLIKVRDWISSPSRSGTSDMSLKYQGVDDPMQFKGLPPSDSVVAKMENDVKCVKSKIAYTAMKAPLGVDSKSVVLNQVSDIDKYFGNANVGAWLNLKPNDAIRELRQKRGVDTGRACKLGVGSDAVKCRVVLSAKIVNGKMEAEFSLRIKRDVSAANLDLGLKRGQALLVSLNKSSFALEACP